MADLARAMGIVLISWALLFIVLSGVGLLVRRLFGLRLQSVEAWLMDFWMGLAVGVCFLQLWNFAFPVNAAPFVILCALGVIGLILNAPGLGSLLTRRKLREGFYLAALAAAAVWVVNRAILAPVYFDTGLYHFSAVRWALSYPVVPGLGLLHHRLAFNSSHFLFIAMLEASLWPDRSYHVANGLLLIVLTAQVLLCGYKALGRSDAPRRRHLFGALLLPAAANQTLYGMVSSLSPDLAVFAAGGALAIQLMSFLDETPGKARAQATGQASGQAREFRHSFSCCVVLSSLCCVMKLSGAALGAVAALVAVARLWTSSERRERRGAFLKSLSWAVLAAVLLGGPFMARGVFQSGYVAYPSAVGGFPVAWRIPAESVQHIAAENLGWARMGGRWVDAPPGWAWLRPWAHQMEHRFVEVSVPLAMAVVAVGAIFATRARKKGQAEALGIRWLFLAPPAASLALWFFGAPAPRMIGAAAWMLGGGATVLACHEIRFASDRAKTLAVALFSVFLTAYALHDERFAGPGPEGGFYSKPVAEMKAVQTRSGLTVYLPAKGSQCWDAPLPCSPGVNPDLRLRRDGDLAGGFVLGGN